MEKLSERFHFASAPVSWGIQDDWGPAWEQPYERILDEILSAGYTGTELGPYGYFPTDPKILAESLKRRGMTILSSFVPVPLADDSKKGMVIEHVRKVGALLSALGAKLLVLSDAQTPKRQSHRGNRRRFEHCRFERSEESRSASILPARTKRAGRTRSDGPSAAGLKWASPRSSEPP